MQTAIENVPTTYTNSDDSDYKFLTAIEVSERFFDGKVGYARVLKMTRDGILPAMKQGKSYIYLQSALEKWTEKTFGKPSWAHKR